MSINSIRPYRSAVVGKRPAFIGGHIITCGHFGRFGTFGNDCLAGNSLKSLYFKKSKKSTFRRGHGQLDTPFRRRAYVAAADDTLIADECSLGDIIAHMNNLEPPPQRIPVY